MSLDGGDVAPGVLGQVGQRPDIVDRLVPAWEVLVNRGGPGERGAARWPGFDPLPVKVIGDAHANGFDAREDVQLVEGDRADAVHGDGIAQRHDVQPADPPRSPGDRPELVAARGDPGADLVVELRRIGSGADPGRVRLNDPDHLVHLERPDPPAGASAAGDRIGGSDEGVTPMIEIQQRPLGAFEEHVLAAGEGALHQPRGVIEMGAEAFAPRRRHLDQRVDFEGRTTHPLEQEVLVGQRTADPFAQDRRVEEVFHAEANPPGPIAVRRSNAAPGRANLRVAEPRLVADVQGHVVRHDHVRAAAHPDAGDIDAARGEHVQLVDQGDRIDHHAVADDRGDVRVEHARWRQAKFEDLVALDHGVAGVVATLVADDHGHPLGQEVRHLALALVAPLEPDDHRGRHQAASPGRMARRVRDHEKRPLTWGPGNRVDLSLVDPPSVRRIAVDRSLGRLTGRPMRPASAIADLLVDGLARAF